jgi:hypothetical protein
MFDANKDDAKSGLVARFLSATDFAPFDRIYAWFYQAGVSKLKACLSAIPEVQGIYLTGSYAIGQHWPGLSDIDYFVVVAAPDHRRAAILSRVDRVLEQCCERYPFLGPPSERAEMIVVLAPDGSFVNDNFNYRRASCLFKIAFEREGFSLPPSPDSEAAVFGLVSELELQIRSVLSAVACEKDNLNFWRTKLRSLLTASTGAPDLSELTRLQCLSTKDEDYLAALWRQPRSQLLKQRTVGDCAACYQIFWKLVKGAMSATELAQWPDLSVPYQLAGNERMGDGGQPVSELIFDMTPKASWDSEKMAVMDEMPERFEFLQAGTWSYEEIAGRLRQWSAVANTGLIIYLDGFVARCIRAEITVTSSYNAPLVTAGGEAPDSVVFKGAFWKRIMQRSAKAVAEFKQEVAEVLEPPAQIGTFAADAQSWGPRKPITMQDDCMLIRRFVRIWRLAQLDKGLLVLYPSADDVFQELKEKYSRCRAFVDLLQRYYLSLRWAEGESDTSWLPPNFFGYMNKYFAAVLNGEEPPAVERMYAKLRVSLCICTRNRQEMLKHLLLSVLEQSRFPDEMVVVDNSDGSETEALLLSFGDRFNLRYVREQSHSIPYLRNQAIKHASGELICFTDDDCVLDPDWIAHAERSMLRSPRIAAVGGIVKHDLGKRSNTVEDFYLRYLGDGVRC